MPVKRAYSKYAKIYSMDHTRSLVQGALKIINPQLNPRGYIAIAYTKEEARETVSLDNYQNWPWPRWRNLILGHTHQPRSSDKEMITKWLRDLSKSPSPIRNLILSKISKFDWEEVPGAFEFKLKGSEEIFSSNSIINILPPGTFKNNEPYLLLEEFETPGRGYDINQSKFYLSSNVSIYLWDWDIINTLNHSQRQTLLREFSKLPQLIQDDLLQESQKDLNKKLFSNQVLEL